MSTPANPLDIFTTYTYHFQLLIAHNWDDLSIVENTDVVVATSPTKGTILRGSGSAQVLIDTRADAHQTIDDVSFDYITPSVDNSAHFIPAGNLTLKIFEPNRVFFIEKISNAIKDNNVSDPTILCWGLKIFFVGRTQNNTIETLPQLGILIPLTFASMESNFSNAGGEYSLSFISLSDFSGSNNENASSAVMLAGYCNQGVTISAKTVKEALSNLEKGLNDNYDLTYKTLLLNKPNARKVKYFINVDKSIDGKLDIIGSNKFDGDVVTIPFSPNQTIVEWMFQILRSSDSLNKLVSESLPGIKQQGHPNVSIISIFPRFVALREELHLIYDVHLYKGSLSKDNTLEFDFMFSDPGKNVDVLGFDIHMTSGLAWFSNNTNVSNDSIFNTSGTAGKKDSSSLIHEDKVLVKNTPTKIEPAYAIPAKGGDFAYLNITTASELTGQVMYKESAITSAKLMFNTIAQMNAAFNPQCTFTIRGNFNLLTNGIIYPPDTAGGKLHKIPFGIKEPFWVKVNIRSPNDEKSAFFYTGFYNLISINHNFSGGKFTQSLNVLMMDH
jgi:hypothetical protein